MVKLALALVSFGNGFASIGQKLISLATRERTLVPLDVKDADSIYTAIGIHYMRMLHMLLANPDGVSLGKDLEDSWGSPKASYKIWALFHIDVM